MNDFFDSTSLPAKTKGNKIKEQIAKEAKLLELLELTRQYYSISLDSWKNLPNDIKQILLGTTSYHIPALSTREIINDRRKQARKMLPAAIVFPYWVNGNVLMVRNLFEAEIKQIQEKAPELYENLVIRLLYLDIEDM